MSDVRRVARSILMVFGAATWWRSSCRSLAGEDASASTTSRADDCGRTRPCVSAIRTRSMRTERSAAPERCRRALLFLIVALLACVRGQRVRIVSIVVPFLTFAPDHPRGRSRWVDVPPAERDSRVFLYGWLRSDAVSQLGRRRPRSRRRRPREPRSSCRARRVDELARTSRDELVVDDLLDITAASGCAVRRARWIDRPRRSWTSPVGVPGLVRRSTTRTSASVDSPRRAPGRDRTSLPVSTSTSTAPAPGTSTRRNTSALNSSCSTRTSTLAPSRARASSAPRPRARSDAAGSRADGAIAKKAVQNLAAASAAGRGRGCDGSRRASSAKQTARRADRRRSWPNALTASAAGTDPAEPRLELTRLPAGQPTRSTSPCAGHAASRLERATRPLLALFAHVRRAERRRRAEPPPRARARDEHEHDDRHHVRQRLEELRRDARQDPARLERERDAREGAEEVRADEAERRAARRRR